VIQGALIVPESAGKGNAMNFDSTLQTAKRATVGRSVLGMVATVCLLASGAFWFSLYWTLLAPASLLSPQTIAVMALSMVYTLALPACAASLAPNSPAAQFLQSKQRETVGFWVMASATVFLSWHAWTMLTLWWAAQPAVAEAGQERAFSIASMIGFVLLPSLSWATVTPEMWLASVRQAQEVKRIKRAEQLEDMAWKAYYARTRSILSAGLANATIAQRQEVAGFLLATARGQQKALHAVAETFGAMHGIELEIPTENDTSLAERYQQVANYLTDAAEVVAPPSGYIPLPSDESRSENAILDDPRSSQITSIRSALNAANAHLGPQPMDDDTRAAIEVLPTAREALYALGFDGQPWMVKDLVQALHIEQPTAQKIAAIWVEKNAVIRGPAKGLAKGRYQFSGGA
jgi:hypothetical protein